MIDAYAIAPSAAQCALVEYRLPGRIHAWLLDHLDSVTWDRDADYPTLVFADDAIASIFWLNFADEFFSAHRVEQEKHDRIAEYQRQMAESQRLCDELLQTINQKLADRQDAGSHP